MYVGFSSATGMIVASSHYVLGRIFKMKDQAQELDLSRLPKHPRVGPKEKPKVLTIGVPSIVVFLMFLTFFTIGFIVSRKIKYDQGTREFVAEIVRLDRLRHRNLVHLFGFCRRKRELLLVYDFMPKGSLDKFLFDQPERILNWNQRFLIIKRVASGLLYLHEGSEKVVLHRDIKASNVLLDGEFNGRLGDFGPAKLYDHGTNPHTTHIVGLPEDIILVDWVLQCWNKGEILEARDMRLGNEYVKEEMELVLKLGLLCSYPMAAAKPSMRQVVQLLDKDGPLPELPSSAWCAIIISSVGEEMESLYRSNSTNSKERSFFNSTSTVIAESLQNGGHC
ncbi:hypothetical protein AAC387_Pa03g2384 [Persea americana]